MQLALTQVVAVETTVDGIEMGVLADGTAYLTLRGLATICGLAASSIIEQVQAWNAGKRTSALAHHLIAAGFTGDRMSIELNATRHAVPDSICVAVLGYYAMKGDNQIATRSLYVLAREGLSKFIYRATGYNPAVVLPPAWRDFHDRVMLSVSVPGYFSVFREMNEFLVRAIQAGMPFSAETVPDISVGKIWGEHWTSNNLDATFGPRRKEPQSYPDHYPQAASNPHNVWVYPMNALGPFRIWMDEHYLPNKFPAYLKGQVRKSVLSAIEAAKLVAAVQPAALPAGP